MQSQLTVSLSPERLRSGSKPEKATFGLLSLIANNRLLTAGQDIEGDELRRGPYVAGYPLAEWFAWNWWRIRWEGKRPSAKSARNRWSFAHAMATVGEGYAWPNISVFTDGLHAFLESEPTRSSGVVSFRYLGSAKQQVVPAKQLEKAIDDFIKDVLNRLDDSNIRDSNLHRLWDDLKTERQDPEVARFRRLEAQLGYDPDEVDEGVLRSRLGETAALGEWALGEVACDAALHGHGQNQMLSATQLSDIARHSGFDVNLDAIVEQEHQADIPDPGSNMAWQVGKYAARSLRKDLDLDGRPVSDSLLSEIVGTKVDTLTRTDKRSHSISLLLGNQDNDGRLRVALKSKWKTGRRFDLVRLVGDHMLSRRLNFAGERLHPATSTYSYRQKAQRAFAAEFLSPFASANEMLNSDYSEEKQNEVAEYFDVSPMTVSTQLVNHGYINLEDAPDVASRGAD